MHYENWRNLLKAFAIMDICDIYQSCKQSGGQMFHHEICDRFGKKDAKLRIARDKHAIILRFQPFYLN